MDTSWAHRTVGWFAESLENHWGDIFSFAGCVLGAFSFYFAFRAAREAKTAHQVASQVVSIWDASRTAADCRDAANSLERTIEAANREDWMFAYFHGASALRAIHVVEGAAVADSCPQEQIDVAAQTLGESLSRFKVALDKERNGAKASARSWGKRETVELTRFAGLLARAARAADTSALTQRSNGDEL